MVEKVAIAAVSQQAYESADFCFVAKLILPSGQHHDLDVRAFFQTSWSKADLLNVHGHKTTQRQDQVYCWALLSVQVSWFQYCSQNNTKKRQSTLLCLSMCTSLLISVLLTTFYFKNSGNEWSKSGSLFTSFMVKGKRNVHGQCIRWFGNVGYASNFAKVRLILSEVYL